MSVCKQINLVAKPAQTEALAALLQSMVEPSRNENGCLKYDLYQQSDDPSYFMLLEIWNSEDHLEQHKLSDHFLQFKSEAPALLAEKSSINLTAID